MALLPEMAAGEDAFCLTPQPAERMDSPRFLRYGINKILVNPAGREASLKEKDAIDPSK